MKMNRLTIYPLALAAALTVLGTGCKHKPVGLTNLPGQQAQVQNPNDNPGIPLDQGKGVGSTDTTGQDNSNGHQQASPVDFDNMIEDRAALAAYTIHFKFDSAAILSEGRA